MRSELQVATNALALVAEAAEAGGVAVGHLLPPPPTSLAGPRSPRSPKSKAKQDDLEYVNSDVTVRDVLTSPITQSALAVGLAALGYLALWYFFRKGIDDE